MYLPGGSLRKHGKAHTPIWTRHQQMMARCYNRTNPAYRDYGGRGICVASDWFDFRNFYRDMGDPPSPNHWIDRIDNNGPYSKENCRWATIKEQCNNRRSNRMISWNGETRNVAGWAAQIGLTHKALWHRLFHLKWPLDKALTQQHRYLRCRLGAILFLAVVGAIDLTCTKEKVCTPEYTKSVRPPVSYTNRVKKQMMGEEHLGGDASSYELDHFIPLELCGDPKSPMNLWPQPWPDARKKDVDETRLHRQVCHGQISLQDAQNAIRKKWGAQ